MPKKLRLDQLLKKKKLVNSLVEATNLINNRKIRISNYNSKFLFKHTLVNEDCDIKIIQQNFVSRGGEKLHNFLVFSKVNVKGKKCLDVGASTGGFTHALIKKGAKKVYCVDVGRSQLDPLIKDNSKVEFFENVNARYDFDIGIKKLDIIVVDVSFISVTMIANQLKKFLSKNSTLIILIKPQFEANRDEVGHGGVIKNVYLLPKILNKVIKNLQNSGLSLLELKKSEPKGKKGNQEYFTIFKLS
ncbi:MAG: SAM-dependent methyltransferase [Chloroflexota bacterium]|nr:SAM-dependent methyltransferase [Chloroflexota bacterium]